MAGMTGNLRCEGFSVKLAWQLSIFKSSLTELLENASLKIPLRISTFKYIFMIIF